MAKATADSVVANRRLNLAFVVLELLGLCTSVQAEANFTLWVNRRSTTDLYSLNSNSTVQVNCGAKPNYLVNEKQCASDEELISGMYANPMVSDVCNVDYIIGCRISIVPINFISLIPTAAAIDSQYSAIMTLGDSPEKNAVLVFGFNGTNQSVNSSFCNISSLEVYRGMEQAIEISHQGFSLGDNGSIEVRMRIVSSMMLIVQIKFNVQIHNSWSSCS